MLPILNCPGSRGAAVVGIVLTIVATAAVAVAQEITYTGSFQFSTGDYIFADRTNSFSIYNGLTISARRLHISTSIPIILQNTSWVSHGGVGVITSGGGQHSEVGRRMRGRVVTLPDTMTLDEVGLGDPLVFTDLELTKAGKVCPSISLTAHIKIPLTDADEGFGTGEWDYGGGISLAQAVGRSFIFVDAIYWILGDLPDLKLRDSFAYSFALGLPWADGKYGVLASFSGSTEILDNVDPPYQAGVGFTARFDSWPNLKSNVVIGMSESSPDFTFSLGWEVAL